MSTDLEWQLGVDLGKQLKFLDHIMHMRLPPFVIIFLDPNKPVIMQDLAVLWGEHREEDQGEVICQISGAGGAVHKPRLVCSVPTTEVGFRMLQSTVNTIHENYNTLWHLEIMNSQTMVKYIFCITWNTVGYLCYSYKGIDNKLVPHYNLPFHKYVQSGLLCGQSKFLLLIV